MFWKESVPGNSAIPSDFLVGYRPSPGLMYCEMFALMLCHDRRSPNIELCHLLAGIYLAHVEKLSKYWQDLEQFEQLVLVECRLDWPRWFYWIQLYEALFHRKRNSFIGQLRRWSIAIRWRNGKIWGHGPFYEKFKKRSPELDAIYAAAKEMAKYRSNAASQAIPVLTPEDLLLAMAKQTHLEVGRKLADSGLDLQRLEQVVKVGKIQPGQSGKEA